MQVIVTGSLGYDYIMDFPGRFADRIMPDKIHNLSLSFLVDKLSKQFGGVAGNIAYSLKLLGVEPLIVACAGNDFSPYKKHLADHKISTIGIKEYDDVACSLYSAVTDQDHNQIGSYFVGAMKHAKELSISEHREGGRLKRSESHDSFKVRPFVIISPTDPKAMVKYVTECQTLKLPYLYDPAFQIATFSADELKKGIAGAAILIGNDYEISLIENRLETSHEELLRLTPIVITTLGAKGSIIETRKEAIHVAPAKPKNTSDPTGAGDAYRAGFLAGYLQLLASRPGLEATPPPAASGTKSNHPGTRPGLEADTFADDLLICGQMGSVAAVYTVETYGTQTHIFTKQGFIERYYQNFQQHLIL